MTVKPARGLVSWWLRKTGYKGITLPPFGVYILEASLGSTRLLRHEAAHWRQAQEMGTLKFYALYLWWLLTIGYEHHPMEVEARAAEQDLT